MTYMTQVSPEDFTGTLEGFLISEVELAIPGLLPGMEYTLEKILGAAIWDLMSPRDHKAAGKCMAWLVRNKYLPQLRLVGRTSSNENLYRLK